MLKRIFELFKIPLICLAIVALSVLILNAVFPLPVERLEEDYSTIFLDREGGLMRIGLSPSGKYRFKLPLDRISDDVKEGLLHYEDRYFYLHPGINPVSVLRALWLNLKSGKIVSGASTISMQTARMMNPKERTITAKLLESLRALQLEMNYSKDEILNIYLNTIPMGGNIEGVGAAAYYYFGKSADELNITEAALLIGIPNSPNANRPDKFPGRAKEVQLKVLERIKDDLNINDEMIARTKDSRNLYPRNENPFTAPHLIIRLRDDTGPGFVRLCIDPRIQDFTEYVLHKHYLENRKERIFNGAVVVIDNRSMEVLAYAGSPDYENGKGGKFNGALLKRAPGSALKPFIYARAMEEGLISPQTKIPDVSKSYGEYAPANYSRRSYGMVSAHDALIRSLNTPAVRLEHDLHGEGLSKVMKTILPLHEERSVEDAGLSIALGGYPITLERGVRLYAAFANGGVFRGLKFKQDEKLNSANDKRILSPEAAFIVYDILSDYYRPDLPFSWEFTPYLAKASLKTGTSFGLRDAWCLGGNHKYTVGVWVGNVDAQGAPSLIGVKKASPIFIEIFNHLSKGDVFDGIEKPANVKTRDVCAVSGAPPGPFCDKLVEEYYIPGVSPQKQCSVHKRIFVRRSDGQAVDPSKMDMPSSEYEERIIEEYPPEIISYFKEHGVAFSNINAGIESFELNAAEHAPQIVSPYNGSEYKIMTNAGADNQRILLKADMAQDSDILYWFANGKMIASDESSGKTFFSPQEHELFGKLRITAVDAMGRSSSVSIKVEK